MKVRATVRAFFLFLITVAAAAFIFLPFAEVTTESFVTTTETITFYQILNFEPRIYTLLNKEINDLLNLLKDVSSGLTIAVLAIVGISFFMQLARIVICKNKVLGAFVGFVDFLLMAACIALGVVAIIHIFTWKGLYDQLEIATEVMTFASLGGWLYLGLGLLTPIVIVLTNFIKK